MRIIVSIKRIALSLSLYLSSAILLVGIFSCEDLELSGSAKLNGRPFLPNDITITNTGTGIYVVLKSDRESLTFWLTERKSGSFLVVVSDQASNHPNPANLPEHFAVVEYRDEQGVFYHGVSGTISISLDGSELRGSFELNVESPQDDEVSITDGEFKGIMRQPVYEGCRVASIIHGERGNESGYQHFYGYGANGNLVSIKTQESPDYISHLLFTYDDKRIVHCKKLIYTSSVTCKNYSSLYVGDKIGEINGFGESISFEYDLNGNLTKFRYLNGAEVPVIYGEDGNVKELFNGSIGSYDNHPNYSELFMQALNNQAAMFIFFGYDFVISPTVGSKNNPLQIGTGTYASKYEFEYGQHQYPIKRVETNMPSTLTTNVQINYRECN